MKKEGMQSGPHDSPDFNLLIDFKTMSSLISILENSTSTACKRRTRVIIAGKN
jgi:hypothetical protein